MKQHALELKRYQAQYFAAISLEDLKKGGGETISRAACAFTRVSEKIAANLVKETSPKKRALRFLYWIKMLKLSYQIGDFTTCASILGVFSTSTIILDSAVERSFVNIRLTPLSFQARRKNIS